MKKSRIIALLTAAVMIMSVVPASAAGYFVDDSGVVYDKSGENLIENGGFEDGLTGLTDNEEYYEVSQEAAHSGSYSLKAIKSTKGDGAITAYFAVEDADASYYLSFWYKNVDSVARRPRVTFAFTDSSKTIPTEEDDFTDETNAWVQAGTASNDQDMAYSKGEWVQYSTVLKGNGNADACKFVALNIYGLTKNVAYVDDFELYELIPSEEYGDAFNEAVANWEQVTMPKGPLTGSGTLPLVRETGVDGVLVEWSSNSVAINAETGEYSSQAESVLAVLTARLYVDGHYDDIYYEYEYPYIVEDMFGPYIDWIGTEVFANLGTAVSGDIVLPATHSITGYYPATITWSATDAIASDGTFTAPEVTKYVDLTATIECNGETTTTTKRIKALGGNLIPEGLEMYYDFETKMNTKGYVYDNAQKAYNADAENVTLVDGYASINGGTIILPSDYPSKLTGSYSVSMWVKLSSAMATSGGMYRFFDFGGGTYTSQFLRYIPSAGQLTFMDRGTAGDGANWAIDTTVDVGKSGWSLVSFTYDMSGGSAAQAKVYVDGVEVANSGDYNLLTNSIYAINSSSNTGFIGRTQWNNADNPDYMGYMDDVRIYSRVLSAEEIATLYEETRPTITAPVTIKYVDTDGNTLLEDVVVSADVDTTYDVPASYKSIPSSSNGQYRLVYKYIASKSDDSITVSENADKNVCTLVFQLEKQAKGTNLIENGSFENGIAGWTNRQGSDITGATIEYDNSIGANVMKIATLGKSSTQTIGTVWNVEIGKDYTISFDIYTAEVLDANNYQYNRLTDGFALGDVGQRENSGKDIIAWGGSLTANSWTHFEKDFTATTDVLYFQSSWSAGEMKFTNFVLEEAGATSDEEQDDEGEKIPVIVKFVDTEGNTIKEDYETEVKQGTVKYTVPASVKNIEDKTEGSVIYKYTYVAEDSVEEVEISILQDNICTLVYEVIKADKNSNIMVDGSFEDENGNFSWGDWQSPQTGNYFRNTCEGWFYKVNRDTNAAALYKEEEITAEDYALGTRWNDGTSGLCSLANFVPVKAGKTYIVSYDYKHKTAGTDASYISTSFVTTKSLTAGAASGSNIPQNVSTEWQTNTFVITAPQDGFIYFHFSWVGSGGGTNTSDNAGHGPYWYFDNFEVLEVITFENEITYENGNVSIVAEDGTTGYVVQAVYNEEGALVSYTVSEKYTFSQETPVTVPVTRGAKIMVFKSVENNTEGFLEPIAPAIIAE